MHQHFQMMTVLLFSFSKTRFLRHKKRLYFLRLQNEYLAMVTMVAHNDIHTVVLRFCNGGNSCRATDTKYRVKKRK